MFEQLEKPEEKDATDYTGLKIGAILAPVIFLFNYFGKVEMGLTVFIVLGATVFAIKLNWKLRRCVWFWAVIVSIFLLHIPLFLTVQWPHGSTPTIAYAMPMGIADFLVIMVAIRLGERFSSKGPSSHDEEE